MWRSAPQRVTHALLADWLSRASRDHVTWALFVNEVSGRACEWDPGGRSHTFSIRLVFRCITTLTIMYTVILLLYYLYHIAIGHYYSSHLFRYVYHTSSLYSFACKICSEVFLFFLSLTCHANCSHFP